MNSRIASRRAPRRRGYSLVELLVVISVSSVLASVAVGLIGILMGVDRGGRRHLHETNALARLAQQFRADVAAAESASSDGPHELHLRLSGGRVVDYASEAGQATREERLGQESQMHEQFSLPEEARLAFEVAADQRPAMASASLAAANDAAGAGDSATVRLGWRVEAAVGRELRFSRQAPIAASNQETSTEDQP
jgi:prepilin-type N-terminal cleavage/methylation domain-containing protein